MPAVLGGGVEKLWFGLGREFARLGHEVTHISRAYAGLPATEIIEGVRHVRVRGFDAPASKIAYRVLDMVYALGVLRRLAPADILVTNTIWLPVLIRDAKKGGALYVHVARYPKGQMRFYGHAARLQTVSETVAEAIRREAPSLASKVRVIPPFLINSPPSIDFDLTWRSRRKTVLYVGRIHPEKGLHLLIPAFLKMADRKREGWSLEIVGPAKANMGGGGDDYLAELKRLSAGRPDVVWHGFVSAEELNDLYQTSSLFVYPSVAEKGESFGSAPLEAMSMGCPALVSDLGCFKEFIEADVTGFVFDHRAADPVAELTRKMEEATASPARLEETAARAYRVAREYRLETISQKYVEDFAAVMREQAGAEG